MVIFFPKRFENCNHHHKLAKNASVKGTQKQAGGERGTGTGREGNQGFGPSGLNVTRQIEQGNPRRQGSGKQAGRVSLL